MLKVARLAALAVALAVAGCVTVDNSLSEADVADMKLTAVSVNVDPGAMIIWEDGLRAYAAAKGVPDDQIMGIAKTPDARSYVRNALAARVKAGVERVANGYMCFLLDPAVFCGTTFYETEIGELATWVKSSKLAQGFDEILLPGEPEARAGAARGRQGIPIDETTWKKICAIAEARAVPAPAANSGA